MCTIVPAQVWRTPWLCVCDAALAIVSWCLCLLVTVLVLVRADLLCFINAADPDVDVFIGLVHLQVHRRARTLRRLADIVSSGAQHPVCVRASMTLLPHMQYCSSSTSFPAPLRNPPPYLFKLLIHAELLQSSYVHVLMKLCSFL